jgi:hypothetical protein
MADTDETRSTSQESEYSREGLQKLLKLLHHETFTRIEALANLAAETRLLTEKASHSSAKLELELKLANEEKAHQKTRNELESQRRAVRENLEINCAIWEASRATTAAPTFFKRISIAETGPSQLTISQCKPGVDAAPSALISSGPLTQFHEELGYKLHHDDTVHSYKDLMPSSDPDIRGMKTPLAVSAVTKKLPSIRSSGSRITLVGYDAELEVKLDTAYGTTANAKEFWLDHLLGVFCIHRRGRVTSTTPAMSTEAEADEVCKLTADGHSAFTDPSYRFTTPLHGFYLSTFFQLKGTSQDISYLRKPNVQSTPETFKET